MTPFAAGFPGLSPPLALFGHLGHWEILIIVLLVLVLFGNRIPGMARNLGRSFTEFKKGIKGEPDDAQKIENKEERGRRLEASSEAKPRESTRP
jgi:sec-independent protein translocase protein TatA